MAKWKASRSLRFVGTAGDVSPGGICKSSRGREVRENQRRKDRNRETG